ncbi:MAG: hypothetical protein C1O27_001706 [Chloroflexi bacterium]|jgi:hypothetical protein|nr:MAG: hypothetical protein C1O27_001706 [Chloroflexota bacterium]
MYELYCLMSRILGTAYGLTLRLASKKGSQPSSKDVNEE